MRSIIGSIMIGYLYKTFYQPCNKKFLSDGIAGSRADFSPLISTRITRPSIIVINTIHRYRSGGCVTAYHRSSLRCTTVRRRADWVCLSGWVWDCNYWSSQVQGMLRCTCTLQFFQYCVGSIGSTTILNAFRC